MHRITTIYNHKHMLSDFNEIKKISQFNNQYQTHYYLQSHCQMSFQDTNHNHDIFTYLYDGQLYSILFIGNIYNLSTIKRQLLNDGFELQTQLDEEILLLSYLHKGNNFVQALDGGFAIIIQCEKLIIAFRDQIGLVPLYYTYHNHTLVLANEMKCLLAYIGKAIVDKTGIKELLALGPSLTPGLTIYKNIYSLRPGFYLEYDDELKTHCYWKVYDYDYQDSFEEAKQKVRNYVIENVKLQAQEDSVCTLLSGGLDSSVITIILKRLKDTFHTYSLTYENQKENFKSNEYQSSMDDSYINTIVDLCQTQHSEYTLSSQQLVDALQDSLIARDMPGMADIDSSFLLFSQYVSSQHHIALSGECADEIFGGYPWFYKEELYSQPYFPWIRELDKKVSLFSKSIQDLQIKDYITYQYQQTLQEIPTSNRNKQLIYLNIQWFMQTLLIRAYTQSLYSSLDIRTPFASTQIIQYLYNMPSHYMFYNQEEKGILRAAFEDMLPDQITHRKKNPFPKTHSPIYKEIIYTKLKESLSDPYNILYTLFDRKKLIELIDSKGDNFQYPWYGQLMMGPQFLAYLYQIYLWSKVYHIEIEL